MRISQFVLRRALEEIGKTLSEVEVFSLAEPTHMHLPNKEVRLSKEILELGGRIEDWDSGLNEFYLDFPGKKHKTGIIDKLDGVTYYLVSFGYNQRIITISETEVAETRFSDLPSKIEGVLTLMAQDEILLSLKN